MKIRMQSTQWEQRSQALPWMEPDFAKSRAASSLQRLTESEEEQTRYAFWDFPMHLCDVQVERLSDFPMLDAVETFAEFPNDSSAVSRAVSGLRSNLGGFLTPFDLLIAINVA
jgi:hypothetical protein